ncbi:hypothetical protein PR048_024787 [Dryococelus australis]|uniref:Uncharacterized protein n=1 Tax=Dryococelus australis TaxID=614101 RepID=A0ABQ9GPI5_9NEOP|nr:hypothetical protein PR048_024787 [Dryococelus australis]
MACITEPLQHSPGNISKNPGKTELRMARQGIEPGSSQMRVQRFTTGPPHLVLKLKGMARLLAFHLGEPGLIPGGVAPGFSLVGTAPDDATGRRVFSGIFSYKQAIKTKNQIWRRRFPLTSKTENFRAAKRVQSPAGPPDFRKRESCRTMPLVGGFSRGSPVTPAPSFRRCSIFASITLIGSQDIAVNRPDLFTSPHYVEKNTTYQAANILIEMSTEQHRNARVEYTGDPRENPPTNGIARYEYNVRKSGSGPAQHSGMRVSLTTPPLRPPFT